MTMSVRLDAAYAHCKQLTATHGRTYYRGTQLLSPARRSGVYALYGFARMVDDIVDTTTGPDRLQQLDDIEADLHAALARPDHRPRHLEVLAVADTAAVFGIPTSTSTLSCGRCGWTCPTATTTWPPTAR